MCKKMSLIHNIKTEGDSTEVFDIFATVRRPRSSLSTTHVHTTGNHSSNVQFNTRNEDIF